MEIEIGTRIKHFRRQQGLSMTALAQKADVAQSGLSDIEAGKRQPTVDWLDRVITALNLTWTEFIDENEPEIPAYVHELINSVQQLTPKQIELLSQFIKSITESSATLYVPQESKWEPLAAHRTDNPMDDLPSPAMDSVRSFQEAYLSENETEYGSKKEPTK